jgi:hypothetical protein
MKKYDTDFFEEHACRGALTVTWLTSGGTEFWLIFNTDPKRVTWIEYCPYCGYRPPNLREDWGNSTKQLLKKMQEEQHMEKMTKYGELEKDDPEKQALDVSDAILQVLSEIQVSDSVRQAALGAAWFILCSETGMTPDRFSLICFNMGEKYKRKYLAIAELK